MGATPFTDPDHYDVSLGGRRCDIKSFLITHRDQISDMKRHPQIVLKAPALVPSDQNAAEGHSDRDIYLFAFLSGLVAASPQDMERQNRRTRPPTGCTSCRMPGTARRGGLRSGRWR